MKPNGKLVACTLSLQNCLYWGILSPIHQAVLIITMLILKLILTTRFQLQSQRILMEASMPSAAATVIPSQC